MMVKRRELEKVARQQQQQYKREYDSDEETDQETGTWEHRLRTAEMDITRGLNIFQFLLVKRKGMFRVGCKVNRNG